MFDTGWKHALVDRSQKRDFQFLLLEHSFPNLTAPLQTRAGKRLSIFFNKGNVKVSDENIKQ
jgi:hypothetical protein